MAIRLYPIQDSVYYFRAGRLTDDTQVLIGRWGNEAVCIRFSSAGKLLGLDSYPIEAVEDVPDRELERVTTQLGVRLGTIRVLKFDFPERTIGILDMPAHLEEYVNAPASFPPETVQDLAADISAWRRGQRFVLVWCEEYWMTREGEVEST